MNSLYPNSARPKKAAAFSSVRGVTLVELMFSTLIFSFVSICTLHALLQGYKVAGMVRVRDQARYVLASVSDQFLRASVTEVTSLSPYTTAIRPFFTVTRVGGVPTPLGTGMGWYGDKQTFVILPNPSYPAAAALRANLSLIAHVNQVDGASLDFQIAANTPTPVDAHLTRLVRAVDPATGEPNSGDPVQTTSGYLLRGDFTMTFRYQNRDYTETNTVIRAVK